MKNPLYQNKKEFEEKFLLETLESEKLRTAILAGLFLGTSIVSLIIRSIYSELVLSASSPEFIKSSLYHWSSEILFLCFLYEFVVYWRYRLFKVKQSKLISFFQIINTTIETSIPTFILFFASYSLPYQYILDSPVVFMYFVFIILSSLRLNFKLCIYTGFVAASEYMMLYLIIIAQQVAKSDAIVSPYGFFMGKSILLFSVGVITGFITLEIKRRINKTYQYIEEKNTLLREYNISLEDKVKARTIELNQSLEKLQEANERVMDSIKYAQRIQDSVLPKTSEISSFLPRSFFLWQPRDIVGGDFYYSEKFHKGYVIAVIDCTGHGVPGAFMTIIAASALRRITEEEKCLDPAEILKRLNQIVKTSLHQDSNESLSDDGLDAAVCYANLEEKTIIFAGARSPLIYIKNKQVCIIKGDKQSVGYKRSKVDFNFKNNIINITPEMSFYLCTDGLTDQVGGAQRMGFGKRRLAALLLDNVDRTFAEQKEEIQRSFTSYRGKNEILDDVTVVGFSVDC